MKIAVIGGAGVRTVNFINGLISQHDALPVSEISLYDIDRPKLEIIAFLGQYAAERGHSSLKVSAAEDVKTLLTGADVVVTTLRVGADHSRVMDEQIALSHGIIGQETTGAGGFFMAARTIPVLLNYMEAIRKYCPNALVFNFTNPSGLVTQALSYAGYNGVLGICDAPSSVVTRMAESLNVPESRLETQFAGLNHLSWIQSVKKNGEEILPSLLDDDAFLKSVQEFAIFDKASFRLSGYLPNEYLYYYYHREKALDSMLHAKQCRGAMIEQINKDMFAELRSMDLNADPEDSLQTFLYYIWKRELSYMTAETGREPVLPVKGKLEIPSGMGYAGVMLSCLEVLQSEKGSRVVLNVPNNGCIPCLRDDDIAELSCIVNNTGIHPIRAKELNAHCTNLLTTMKAYERTAAEAILMKSRDKAVEALTLHPLVFSYSLADRLVDELISAYPNDVELH